MALKIEKETAKKLYPDVPEWFQEKLIKEFGEGTFKKRKFTDIKTFEGACEELGIDTAQFHGGETPDEEAYKKLKIITKAINQGWVPDWDNGNQRKWWPYFNLSSGFGFSFSSYYCADTFTLVGSRLCFETEEKVNYAGKQFLEIYKVFLK